MTDTLHLIRENRRVASVNPDLEAAIAYANAQDPDGICVEHHRAFLAGCEFKARQIAERLERLLGEVRRDH